MSTALKTNAGTDAGPIRQVHEFAVPTGAVAKSRLDRQGVTEAAVRGTLQDVEKSRSGQFEPEPLDSSRPDVRGTFRPAMRQTDPAIDWKGDRTDAIVARINSADSAPGVLDTLLGSPFYLYGAHYEERLKGAPGELIAQRDGAVCVATVDGAVWISHLKAKDQVSLETDRATGPGEDRNGEPQCVRDFATEHNILIGIDGARR